MVVECAACHTRFRLADDKLKPGGTKVRCSRCKHVFSVVPPAAADTVDATGVDSVEQPETTSFAPAPPPTPFAAAEPPPPVPFPSISEPPSAEDEIDFGDFNMEPVSADTGETEPAAAAAPDFDELDLGGLDERGAAVETPTGAAPVSEATELPGEFTFGQASTEEPSVTAEFSLGEQDPFPPEGFEGPQPETGPVEFDFEETGLETFSLGAVSTPSASAAEIDEFALGDEEVPAPSSPAAAAEREESDAFSFDIEETFAADQPAPAEDFDFGFSEEAAKEFAFDEAESSAFSAGGTTTADTEFAWGEVDSPGSTEGGFDFDEPQQKNEPDDDFDFGNRTFDEPEPPLAAPPPPAAGPRPTAAAQAGPAGSAATTMPAPRPAPPPRTPDTGVRPAVPAVGRRRGTSLFSRLLFLLMLLVLGAGGAAVYFYWRGEIPQLTQLVDRLTGQQPPTPVSGEIRIEGLSSNYVSNRAVGSLLVIRGSAVNAFPGTRSSIAVRAILLDKAGNSMLQQTVFAGNPLDDKTLQSLPFAKIEENMNNPFGAGLSNMNIPPGKAIPFAIVFRNLPAQVAEFTVEIVDSKPGTKQ